LSVFAASGATVFHGDRGAHGRRGCSQRPPCTRHRACSGRRACEGFSKLNPPAAGEHLTFAAGVRVVKNVLVPMRDRVLWDDRGRDCPCGRPPAQIPACVANALGSCLGSGRRSARQARDARCGRVGAIGSRGGASASSRRCRWSGSGGIGFCTPVPWRRSLRARVSETIG
jgi:hypothetical protein